MESPPITELLQRWIAGDSHVTEELFAAVYPELKAIARGLLARRRGEALQTTELVHEAYVRLEQQRAVQWKSREHLYGIASLVMRRLLVDAARAQGAQRRGGDVVRIELREEALAATGAATDVLALDEALGRLERDVPRAGAVVTLRYFGGMTMAEIATALDVSLSTVEKDWHFARAWLRRRLEKEPAGPGD